MDHRIAKPRSWSAIGWAIAYWISAPSGAVVLVAAWVWMGLTYYEEMTEQCKALAASTSMEGLGLALGLIPLLAVHAIGLLVLGGISIAGRSSLRSATVHTLVAVVAPSILGLVLTQLMLGGTLFATGAGTANCYPNSAP